MCPVRHVTYVSGRSPQRTEAYRLLPRLKSVPSGAIGPAQERARSLTQRGIGPSPERTLQNLNPVADREGAWASKGQGASTFIGCPDLDDLPMVRRDIATAPALEAH